MMNPLPAIRRLEDRMAALRLLVPLVTALAGTSYAQDRTTEQRTPVRAAFESDQVRVRHVQLAPGERAEIVNHRDSLLIPFTADLEGRVPVDAAAFRPMGTTTLENRAAVPFAAVLVELIAPSSSPPASLPPEVAAARIPAYSPVHRMEGHRVQTIVDNSRVLVTRHRLPAWQPRTEPVHWHPREVLLVYLGGGEIDGAAGRLGSRRVRRGDFDVLPADVPHAFHNAGNDPIEFLMITPK
jgi:quercetin dioxygenase-like cupin family protein